ncbi:MAG: hypothetical protein COW24_04435 [Candidatus Kerfeldbacteria bacterium CG15_BIG_FIL_POST_REV_8_21_14_020_45_12]|uniref:Uncharacterized protein n=1 Tax=Candidatus Kerfeldbacteria bacterium CG15_BIG_FIL_POST_REV_8_21_14_020_45_12 TaxID=2014247 RepID=A0A2M7H2W6_9BACT|nr:MAG: hypothetical protein COW24_04435 [Candidatus Kerfeldbacteria bacterium CG15_BIG_FIL_POST_REV_8_21_14_020_45_12]PJA93340.1 MAG: hypothetical protein CO132_03210 [Candidatus Kerfeldbacteria bacterium CG_4_9_14_3_um_filter_45_8]
MSELTAKREELSVQAHKLYARREIRARWTEKTFQRLILDAKSGADILEIPQVREIVGKLHRWEREHPNSIVGAALVGPPGTGKSTGVEYYLEKMGRPEPIRMDVSQELTRYALFGSPEVQFESDIDRYRKLAERVGSLSEADVLSMVQKHADKLGAALGDMNPEERSVIALASLKEEVDEILRAGGEMDTDAHAKVQALRGALEGLANGQYQSELATQLADITHKNGWRDGMIIHALRHQRPLIIDEFNAAKSWTLLNKLLTSKPGEDYFFADNNESIKIPDWYRIYFTANIGGKYGRFKVQEDLMSRFGKRVIEVDYPPAEDEFMVMVAFVCNAYTEMLRDKVDMYKLGTFVRTVVPKLRAAMNESKQASNPISFRTYREIGETLVTPGPAGTERKSNSVDKAVLESVVNPFAGWEDRTLAKTLVQLMLESDLLLDDESVWPEVTRWTGISHEELQQKKDDMDTDKRRAAADQLLDGAQQAFAARMMASGQGL